MVCAMSISRLIPLSFLTFGNYSAPGNLVKRSQAMAQLLGYEETRDALLKAESAEAFFEIIRQAAR